MLMPFGKYRGQPLSVLPDDYLAWLRTIELRQPLVSAVLDEVERRQGPQSGPRPPNRRGCPAPEVALELVGAGLKRLASKHHPDAGGTHEAMIGVTAAAEWLRARIQEAA